jgi:hypothetical protein
MKFWGTRRLLPSVAAQKSGRFCQVDLFHALHTDTVCEVSGAEMVAQDSWWDTSAWLTTPHRHPFSF